MFTKPLLQRLLWIGSVILATLAGGTIGFMIIEGYDWFDAFYMTLITITTIGYGELFGLSRVGRMFNSVLIMVGATLLLVAIAALSQTILELELSGYFPKRRTRKMIDGLRDHVIVCGYGRVGRGAAEELQRAGTRFVIVDRNEDKVERALHNGMLAVNADCTRDETLRDLGIDRALGLIASLATDADNLFLVISAKTLNPKLHVCARVAEEEAESKLRRAGADQVMAPYLMTGAKLAQSIVRPHVMQFLDFATMTSELRVSIEQILVTPSCGFADRALRDVNLRKEQGVIVLAIRKQHGPMIFNPDADAVIHSGDFLIVMGEEPHLRSLERLMAGARG